MWTQSPTLIIACLIPHSYEPAHLLSSSVSIVTHSESVSAKGKGVGSTTKRSASSSKTSDKGGEEAKPESLSKKDDEPAAAKKANLKVDVPPPPGGPVEIVFSFDTTGSMYPCLTQVRAFIGFTHNLQGSAHTVHGWLASTTIQPPLQIF